MMKLKTLKKGQKKRKKERRKEKEELVGLGNSSIEQWGEFLGLKYGSNQN